jgi:hypothetical protein
LAGSTSLVSAGLGVPLEYVPRMSLIGAGFSLWLSWNDSREETKPKRRKSKGRAIPFRSAQGVTNVYPDALELSMGQSGTLTRETYWQGIKRKWSGTPGLGVPIRPVTKEFVFISQGMQLQQVHVELFLKSAWRNRKSGKGLSGRRWVRNFNQRPAWYQELSPTWYYAMMQLLYDAQIKTGWQLIYTLDNQQSFLNVEPYHLIRILRGVEIEKQGEV